MAFNISITKNKKVDFKKLHALCEILDREFVSVFPMSNKNFKKHQGIGISININENYGDFFTGLEFFLKAVIEQKFNVVELYNSGIIKNEKDIQKLIKLIK